MSEETSNPAIVLCVPGPWETREAFIAAFTRTGIKSSEGEQKAPRFLAAGGVVTDIQEGLVFMLDLQPHTPGLGEALKAGGRGMVDESTLAAVATHKSVAYVFSASAGERELRSMAKLAEHFFQTGGFAANLECVGVSHGPERFRFFAEEQSAAGLVELFTVLVGGDGIFYTCGMHQFGRADVSVDKDIGVNDACEILYAFNQWQLLESPLLEDGRPFCCGDASPVFTMVKQPYGYDQEDWLNNPHGRWHLRPADLKRQTTYRSDVGDPVMVMVPNDDPDMLAAMGNAQKDLATFLKRADSQWAYGNHMVKFRFEEGADSGYFWLGYLGHDEATITAHVFEIPEVFGLKPGDQVTRPRGDACDWCVIRNGTLMGGYTMRVARAKLPKDKLQAHDQFTGMISFEPVDQ